MSMQGDYVALELNSSDTTTAVAFTLKDANNVARTLAVNERLVIDVLFGNVATAVVLAQVFDDKDADGNVDAGELIAAFGIGNVGGWIGGMEGFSVSPGSVPKVKGNVAGVVVLTGVGRITKATTEGVRPSWQAARQ